MGDVKRFSFQSSACRVAGASAEPRWGRGLGAPPPMKCSNVDIYPLTVSYIIQTNGKEIEMENRLLGI